MGSMIDRFVNDSVYPTQSEETEIGIAEGMGFSYQEISKKLLARRAIIEAEVREQAGNQAKKKLRDAKMARVRSHFSALGGRNGSDGVGNIWS